MCDINLHGYIWKEFREQGNGQCKYLKTVARLLNTG